jgi:hypothetical protein
LPARKIQSGLNKKSASKFAAIQRFLIVKYLTVIIYITARLQNYIKENIMRKLLRNC